MGFLVYVCRCTHAVIFRRSMYIDLSYGVFVHMSGSSVTAYVYIYVYCRGHGGHGVLLFMLSPCCHRPVNFFVFNFRSTIFLSLKSQRGFERVLVVYSSLVAVRTVLLLKWRLRMRGVRRPAVRTYIYIYYIPGMYICTAVLQR